MDLKILNMICCPACKSALRATAFEEPGPYLHLPLNTHANRLAAPRGGSILVHGALLCDTCKVWFPVYAFVPVLLLFRTRFHDRFCARFQEQVSALSGYSLPSKPARPGERRVQESFTMEWQLTDLERDVLSFTYTLDDLVALNREVWLKDIDQLESLTTVLDVGCGAGMEALALQRLMGQATVFAVDVNFALFKSGPALAAVPELHLIMASLFDLPFRQASFDLVYCQGVLHHTFSTMRAFESLSQYPRPGGYLFVWVYGLDDHLVPKGLRGCLARAKYRIEAFLRPVISWLPGWLRNRLLCLLGWVLHPLFRGRVRHRQAWTLRHTTHSLYDWLSPRYAHRHSYNEVVE